MKYNLNPCQACIDRYGENANVNDINNCVYEIATDFLGRVSTNALNDDDSLRKNCSDCVSKYSDKMSPFGDKRINPPPVFADTPSFLPTILETSESIGEATNKCISMCYDYAVNKNECISKCKLQASACKEEYIQPIQSNKSTEPEPVSNISENRISTINIIVIIILLIIFIISILYLLK